MSQFKFVAAASSVLSGKSSAICRIHGILSTIAGEFKSCRAEMLIRTFVNSSFLSGFVNNSDIKFVCLFNALSLSLSSSLTPKMVTIRDRLAVEKGRAICSKYGALIPHRNNIFPSCAILETERDSRSN